MQRVVIMVCLVAFVVAFTAGAALAASHDSDKHKMPVREAADKFVKSTPDNKFFRVDVKDLKMMVD